VIRRSELLSTTDASFTSRGRGKKGRGTSTLREKKADSGNPCSDRNRAGQACRVAMLRNRAGISRRRESRNEEIESTQKGREPGAFEKGKDESRSRRHQRSVTEK